MNETGIARLAVSVALCEASTQEVLRFNPDDPAVKTLCLEVPVRVPGLCLEVPVRVPGLLEAAPPISASSASNQLP